MSDSLCYTVDGGAGVFTIDAPATRNALSLDMVDAFLEDLPRAEADPQVRAVVITGTGTTFSSGANLSASGADRERAVTAFPELLTALIRSPKPVVAMINGHVRAGGVSLVAAADIAVAPEGATFAFPEVRVGISPAIVAALCLRCTEARRTQRYLLTGETFGAVEAAAIGLVTATVADDEVEPYVKNLLASLAQAGPQALARTKWLLAELRSPDLEASLRRAAEVSAEVFASDEAAEGLAAFREKRTPAWAT